LAIPVSSADVLERSFSKKNQIVSPQRSKMTNTSARIQAMLAFNGDLEQRFVT